MFDYLRLALATGVVLSPGALLGRAFGRRSASAALAWSMAALFVAWAAVFALHGTIRVAIAVLVLIAAAAAPFALRAGRVRRPRGGSIALGLGVVFGLLLWHVSGPLAGDALFHLARVRKLEELGSLSLHRVDEFRDGGLHPGYAFPLWHGFLALVARIAGVDPAVVVRHEASVLAPLAFAVTYEAGLAVFRSVGAGFSVLAAQVALIALAPGHGGAYTSLALPPTASRQLLVPAVTALFFWHVQERSRALLASIAAGSLALALVHPTYAVFLCLPLGGYLVARWALARADVRAGAEALAALALPTLAVLLWLRPIVAETISHDPSDAELRRALAHYGDQLDVFSTHSYRLAPEVIGRGGAVAVAALVLVPVAALAARQRWAALVLGGSAAVLAPMLVPFLFTHLSDVVSLSQSRRAAGFLPFAFALAGGLAVLARPFGRLLAPAALAAGIALQLLWPGDFAYGLDHGGPAAATWIAAIGGAAALVLAAILRPRGLVERPALLATALLVLPVAVHGFAHWSPRERTAAALPASLVDAVRARVPKGAIVFSDPATSYRLAAYAPVYVASAPVPHVANTRANRPDARRRDALEFLRTGDLAIPRRYGATWIVRRKGARFVLYRLG